MRTFRAVGPLLFLGAIATRIGAQPFNVAARGCAMAHCDVTMSDNVGLIPPMTDKVQVKFHDALPPGSGIGLGCSSNSRVVVCSSKSITGDNVIAYSPEGVRLWTSGTLFNLTAMASAPMVNRFGGVIAADDTRIIRFDFRGSVVWNTSTLGGTPISPVVTENGTVVLATKGGPVSAYNSSTGEVVGSLYVRESVGDAAWFETVNTPCVVGNRAYISMAKINDIRNKAWLVALDIDPANKAEPLRVAWRFTFGGPSTASPLCLDDRIYFDGERPTPGVPRQPHMFAVRDEGASGALLWSLPAVNSMPASFAHDPRGGFWTMYYEHPVMERRSAANGALMDSIDISALVGGAVPNTPFSAITIAGTRALPVMIIGAWARGKSSSHVLAIDLRRRELLWKININPTFGNDAVFSQFPIAIDSAGKPVVVFSGYASGAFFVGEP